MGLLAVFLWGRTPSWFARGHWLFSYSDGVWRRSLPGSLLELAGGSLDDVLAVSLGIYGVAVLTLARTLPALVVVRGRLSPVRGTLVGAALLSPAGYPFLAAGLGRFDTILITLAAGAAVVVARARGPRRDVGLAALLALSMLVHEGALLLVAVWLVAYYCWTLAGEGHGTRHVVQRGAGQLLVCVTVWGAVSLATPPVSPGELAERYTSLPAPWPRWTASLQYGGLLQDVSSTWRFVTSPTGFYRVLWDVVSVVPVVLMALVALRSNGSLESRDRVLFAGCFAPLGLCAVGTDWGRWMAFFAVSLVVTTALVLRQAHARPTRGMIASATIVVLWTVATGGIFHHAVPLF